MTIKNFLDEFRAKGIRNTITETDIVSKYIKRTLEVKDYVPFAEKRALCERVLDRNSVV